MSSQKFSIHEYTPQSLDTVMLWVDDRESGCLECVPRTVAKSIIRAHEGLTKIAAGDGCYGAQAFEYKNIARTALGFSRVGAASPCDKHAT